MWSQICTLVLGLTNQLCIKTTWVVCLSLTSTPGPDPKPNESASPGAGSRNAPNQQVTLIPWATPMTPSQKWRSWGPRKGGAHTVNSFSRWISTIPLTLLHQACAQNPHRSGKPVCPLLGWEVLGAHSPPGPGGVRMHQCFYTSWVASWLTTYSSRRKRSSHFFHPWNWTIYPSQDGGW